MKEKHGQASPFRLHQSYQSLWPHKSCLRNAQEKTKMLYSRKIQSQRILSMIIISLRKRARFIIYHHRIQCFCPPQRSSHRLTPLLSLACKLPNTIIIITVGMTVTVEMMMAMMTRKSRNAALRTTYRAGTTDVTIAIRLTSHILLSTLI